MDSRAKASRKVVDDVNIEDFSQPQLTEAELGNMTVTADVYQLKQIGTQKSIQMKMTNMNP